MDDSTTKSFIFSSIDAKKVIYISISKSGRNVGVFSSICPLKAFDRVGDNPLMHRKKGTINNSL